jgi:hypothetical protein
MPNVPQVPGVPNLSSYASNAVTLIVADAVSFLFGGGAQDRWGVFQDGAVAFDYDSFNGLSFRKDFVVADYPVEAPGSGQSSGFMSYDKVEMPFECRVRLISGGSEADREALLVQVENAAQTLDLFDVVTPERLYEDCNIVRYSYERTAVDGVGVIKIDVTFQQIRTSETSAFSNTKQPGSAAQVGGGTVQGTTANQSAKIESFPLPSVQ